MRPSISLRMLQPTRRMMAPVPKDDHTAHTISQRLRKLRQVPPELIPLGVVVSIAILFGAYSMGRKFVVDKQIRLARQNRKD